MRLVSRFFAYVFGLLLAIPAGFVALAIGIALEPAAQELIAALGAAGIEDVISDMWSGGLPEVGPGEIFVHLWVLSATLLVLPPALVALIGEVAGIRSFVWYGFGCGTLMAALPWLRRSSERFTEASLLGAEGRITALLFVVGAVAGLTYWLVSGRRAGTPSTP